MNITAQKLIPLCAALVALGLSSEARAEPSPWVVDASVGALRLKSDEFRFAGDATLGYATRSLGVVGSGYVSAYDIQKPTLLSDYLRGGGGAEFWWLSASAGRGLHLELRATGSGQLYSSDSYLLDRQEFLAETSVFGRGGALLGLKYDPSDTVLAELILGGGVQFEDYSRDNATGADSTFINVDKQSTTVRGEGRFLLRWRFWPEHLAGRVRASGQTFSINRTTETLLANGGAQTTTVANEVTEFRQTEVSARLFADVEAASVLGVTPGVFAGLDLFAVTASAGSVTTVVPLFGLGLFRSVD